MNYYSYIYTIKINNMRKNNLEKTIAISLIVIMYGFLGYLTYSLYIIEKEIEKLELPTEQ